MLAGRVALVTGASTGIGRVTAMELARLGARVFLACRSEERTRPVLEKIGSAAQWLPLELSDFDSVRACARMFLEQGLPLHLLVNNAGVAGARGLTPSGFEWMFGVNHMGHFLLTQLLLERIRSSAPARIVTVASKAHRHAGAIDWGAAKRPTASLTGIREYSVSKLANILFSAELAKHLRGTGVSTYSLHPGVVDSDIWRRLPGPLRALNRLRLISNEEGARTTLHCAVSEAAGEQTGLYYSESRPVLPNAAGQSEALARELWERSEAALG